jgi:cyclic pyranopterin monophosphate synthase
MSDRLTHVGPDGTARMVDVGAKAETARTAVASGTILMQPATLAATEQHTVAKGDVLAVARVAGIMAAKRTADLIPLCHPLPISECRVELHPQHDPPGVRVVATVRTVGRTGVEMEALTAASVALLTIYDMAKAMDRGMEVTALRLDHKSGGAGGEWNR